MRQLTSLVLFIVCIQCTVQTAAAEETYRSAREAFSAGARLYNSRQYAAAEAPLEAALKLMPDARMLMDLHGALFNVYRETAKVDKAVASGEFLIRNYDRKAGRSLSSRNLTGFLLAQGKTDMTIARYEELLKKEPEDLAALHVLSQVYARGLHKNPERHAVVAPKLEATERKLAAGLAVQLETQAGQKPAEAASLLKDAAQIWLEAGDKAKALETAKKAQGVGPDKRSPILTYFWYQGMGDVYAECGEKDEAIKAYEESIKASGNDVLAKSVQKKLDAVKNAAKP